MDEALSLSSYLVFNTVAKSGNISAAAKELVLSQPAVSRSLKKLEDGLAVKLFVRGSRGVRLTNEGELLYAHTRTAFDSITAAENTLRQASVSGFATISFGISDYLCRYFGSPFIKAFLQANPRIKFDLHTGSSPELFRMVEDGALEAAIICKPLSVHRLEYLELTELQDIFVASPSYMNLVQSLPSGDLFEKSALLLPKSGTASSNFLHSAFSSHLLSPSGITEVANPDLALDFALSGLGIAFVPLIAAEDAIKKGTLVRVPFVEELPTRSIGIVYKKTSTQTQVLNSIIKHAQEDSL